jgi:hypothetical protein
MKIHLIALLSVLALPQVALSDTALAATPAATTGPVSLVTLCEGPGAPPRDAEPCAGYWNDVLSRTAACMSGVSSQREAYRHRYVLCAHQVRASYQAASQ